MFSSGVLSSVKTFPFFLSTKRSHMGFFFWDESECLLEAYSFFPFVEVDNFGYQSYSKNKNSVIWLVGL